MGEINIYSLDSYQNETISLYQKVDCVFAGHFAGHKFIGPVFGFYVSSRFHKDFGCVLKLDFLFKPSLRGR